MIRETQKVHAKFLAGLCLVLALQAAPSTVAAQSKGLPPAFADVRAFGAVGDGRRDDTAAFEAALKTGLPLLIPATKRGFVITRSLMVAPGQSVIGLGKAASVIRYRGEGPCFTPDPMVQGRSDRLLFRDFTIWGEGRPKAIGIQLLRSKRSMIENVFIRDIGGIGIVIDGAKGPRGGHEAHYAYIQNVGIGGNHRIGLQIRGRSDKESSNRHRVFFLRDNGASEVALDIWKWVDTSVFYGFATEGVNNAIRIGGKQNQFFGTHLEKTRGNGVEFLEGAMENQFYGFLMGSVGGKRWVNPQFNADNPRRRRADAAAARFLR